MYLEGMEEASVFVHIAVNDVTGKVGKVELTEETNLVPVLLVKDGDSHI